MDGTVQAVGRPARLPAGPRGARRLRRRTPNTLASTGTATVALPVAVDTAWSPPVSRVRAR